MGEKRLALIITTNSRRESSERKLRKQICTQIDDAPAAISEEMGHGFSLGFDDVEARSRFITLCQN